MGLIIRSSDIHAAGCYTTGPIKKDTKVIRYEGPIMTKEQGDARYDGRDDEHTYLFGLDDGRVIDGHGMAMFINHSCDPNCETDGEDDEIWIVAIRDIEAGEELTYDYCLWDGSEDDPSTCACGAKNCRGTMYTEEEVDRLKNLRSKKDVTKDEPTRVTAKEKELVAQ